MNVSYRYLFWTRHCVGQRERTNVDPQWARRVIERFARMFRCEISVRVDRRVGVAISAEPSVLYLVAGGK